MSYMIRGCLLCFGKTPHQLEYELLEELLTETTTIHRRDAEAQRTEIIEQSNGKEEPGMAWEVSTSARADLHAWVREGCRTHPGRANLKEAEQFALEVGRVAAECAFEGGGRPVARRPATAAVPSPVSVVSGRASEGIDTGGCAARPARWA